MRPRRRLLRGSGGTPVEEAPWWVLAILVAVLALVLFPALVGLVDGLSLSLSVAPRFRARAHLGAFAMGSAALAIALVATVATRAPWRRQGATDGSPWDRRPWPVRLSSWAITTVLLPNLLHGLLVLASPAPPEHAAAVALGLLVSGLQGLWVASDRWRSARRRRTP